jgi:hypothetical protein
MYPIRSIRGRAPPWRAPNVQHSNWSRHALVPETSTTSSNGPAAAGAGRLHSGIRAATLTGRLAAPSLPFAVERRGSQVVRSGSAKPLFAGSIPAPASSITNDRERGIREKGPEMTNEEELEKGNGPEKPEEPAGMNEAEPPSGSEVQGRSQTPVTCYQCGALNFGDTRFLSFICSKCGTRNAVPSSGSG